MESRGITNTAKVFISIYNIVLFAAVWINYYNKYAFQKFAREGLIVSLLIYILVYFALCQLYKSFKIASSSVAETGLSQFISFALTDLLLYVVCCLAANIYVNVIPGIITVILQIIGTLILVMTFKRYMMKHIAPKKTVIVYGKGISNREVEEFMQKLCAKYEHLFTVVKMCEEFEDICTYIGGRDLYETVMLYEVSESCKGQIIKHCLNSNQNIYFTPSVENILIANCEPKHLVDTPMMKYDFVYKNTVTAIVKRIIDIVVSLIIIIITSPFMLITAIAIKIEDRGPVIFKQKRCTLDCKEFYIYKFRSMIVDSEKDGFKPCTANDDRITKVGHVIRKLRIDELPQLFNILLGDMSIVGPRPERIEHVQKYTADLPEFILRTRVKAGLTGYAQIYGKYNTTAYDKLRLDLMYIENMSLVQDFKLILLTIKIVFVPESTEGFEESKSKAIAKSQLAAVVKETAAAIETSEK